MLALLSGVAGITSAGCSAVAEDRPRDRVGALPFPGLFTLHHTIDASDLGRHRYSRWPRWFQSDERERGILYTTRAGFLDLAHIRITIDLSRYTIGTLRRSIEAGDKTCLVSDPDGNVYHVSLNYPQDWPSLPPQRRQQMIDELALRGGQQLSYLMVTWHEIITWFGYSTVFFVSESRSAFSYEDTMSHIVGLRVVERVMRDRTADFDDAVTAALAAELHDLGVVTAAQADAAARAVQGIWWTGGGRPLKRHVDVGFESGVVYPWLVPGLPFGDAQPEPFRLPRLDNIAGRDMTGFFTMEIESRIWQTQAIRNHLPAHPRLFHKDRDIPVLLGVVRSQMQQTFGPAVNSPASSVGAGVTPTSAQTPRAKAVERRKERVRG